MFSKSFPFLRPLLALALTINAASASLRVVFPSDDTQVALGSPDSNYGTLTSIYVAGAASGTSQTERGWLKFNLREEIPPNATISSATLRLFFWRSPLTNTSATIQISESDDWSEEDLTWNTQPEPFFDEPEEAAVIAQTTLVGGAGYTSYEFDVTGAVGQEWNGDGTISLVVRLTPESGNASVAFNTRETDLAYVKQYFNYEVKNIPLNYAPQLRVTYEDGSWDGANGYTIYHVNDQHSRLTPHDLDIQEHDDEPVFERVGGMAYLSARLIELVTADPNALVLEGGDISEGNPLGDLRGNGGMVEYLNELHRQLQAIPGRQGRGIDAMVVGNHDVRKLDMVENMQNLAEFPIVSMNLLTVPAADPYTDTLFPPYTIVETNGLRIGVLGFTNDISTYIDETTGLLSVANAVWSDGDAATIDIKTYVEKLRRPTALGGEGCDQVIFLQHIGHRRTMATYKDLPPLLVGETSVRVPEIVISGHWHTGAQTVWQPAQYHGRTLVSEAASYMQYIGELRVDAEGRYVSATKHPVRVAQIEPNPEMETILARLKVEYEAGSPTYQIDQTIGFSAVPLRMDKDRWWTINEYPWYGDATAGFWICDAMLWKANQAGLNVDIAFQSGGGIRRDVPAGDITYMEIYETYPWPDDNMVVLPLTGAQIKSYIEEKGLGASLSQGWLVRADDGKITELRRGVGPGNPQGTLVADGDLFNAAISQYMYDHETLSPDDYFADLPGKIDTTISIRGSAIEYTSQFTRANPMQVPLPRYESENEFAGGFRAVVTMVNDAQNEPFFECLWVRLLSVAGETLTHRGREVLETLVRPDGSVDPAHQSSEMMLYRSHLDILDGYLRPGDIIETWGEGGFFRGTPEFIDQEGIYGLDTEWKILGHDPNLARPAYYPAIADFWNEWHENHYVQFYAVKTGTAAVQDNDGTTLSTLGPDGYDNYPLPGQLGDLLSITGVVTQRDTVRQFRVSTAAVVAGGVANGLPPYSRVEPLGFSETTAAGIHLTAQAADLSSGGGMTTNTFTSVADAHVSDGNPNNNYGSNTSLYIQSSTVSYKNEQGWIKFDLTSLPAGVSVSQARLELYCWSVPPSATLPIEIRAAVGANADSWTESDLKWNNQPADGGTALVSRTMTPSDKNKWITFNLTSQVQTECAGDRVVSILVRPTTYNANPAVSYAFDAREYSGGSVAPRLVVDHNGGSGFSGQVTEVRYYYRYSSENANWSDWTLAGTASAEPWTMAFNFPAGTGYYEFYSVALDDDNLLEPAPVVADVRVRYRGAAANLAPAAPLNVGLPNGSVIDRAHPTLSVLVSDPERDALDVTFHNAANDLVFASIGAVPSGQIVYGRWEGLTPGYEYAWYAVAADSSGASTRSATYTFGTAGQPVDSDDDSDGVNAGLESFFGTGPSASPHALTRVVRQADGSFSVFFPASTRTGSRAFVEWSRDLVEWHRESLFGPVTTGQIYPHLTDCREKRIDLPEPGQNQAYFRFVLEE